MSHPKSPTEQPGEGHVPVETPAAPAPTGARTPGAQELAKGVLMPDPLECANALHYFDSQDSSWCNCGAAVRVPTKLKRSLSQQEVIERMYEDSIDLPVCTLDEIDAEIAKARQDEDTLLSNILCHYREKCLSGEPR
jgi:hypothetical protein